jgi:hypothetical protein
MKLPSLKNIFKNATRVLTEPPAPAIDVVVKHRKDINLTLCILAYAAMC